MCIIRLRSYVGYPPVRDTLPNTTHFALAALQYSKNITNLITQNVDGLHHKAIKHVWDDTKIEEGILELHGTLHVGPCFLIDQDSALHCIMPSTESTL